MKKILSKSSQKKKKTSQTSTKNNGDSKRSRFTPTITTAPSAVTSTPRVHYTFTGASGGVSRIRACVPFFQVCLSPDSIMSTTYGPGCIRTFVRQTTGSLANINTVVQTLLFNPARCVAYRWDKPTLVNPTLRNGDAYFTSSFIDNYACLFTRMRLNHLRLIYCPQQSTSAASFGRRFVLNWTSDPFHPVLGAAGFQSATPGYLLETSAVAMTDSVPFAPWLPFAVDCKLNPSWVNTFSNSAGGIESSATTLFAGDTRSAFFGAISVTSDQVGSIEVQGYMYAEMDIEFTEPNPLVVSNPSIPVLLREAVGRRSSLPSEMPPTGDGSEPITVVDSDGNGHPSRTGELLRDSKSTLSLPRRSGVDETGSRVVSTTSLSDIPMSSGSVSSVPKGRSIVSSVVISSDGNDFEDDSPSGASSIGVPGGASLTSNPVKPTKVIVPAKR